MLIRIEGWRVNHQKIGYLWSEGGIQLPHRHKKWWQLYHHASSVMRLRLTHPNHIWVIGFVHDKRSNGRSLKILTVLDGYTRKALCVEAQSTMTANRRIVPNVDKTWQTWVHTFQQRAIVRCAALRGQRSQVRTLSSAPTPYRYS